GPGPGPTPEADVAGHQLACPPPVTETTRVRASLDGWPGQRGLPDGAPRPVLRCLVVDHQPAALEQLARMLRTHPYVRKVSTAADSLDALRLLRDDDVDV